MSRALNTEKLGASKNLYLIKSLFSLRDDGGDISMIDVIILKKYDYYYFDMISKKRYSVEKYDKIESSKEEIPNDEKFKMQNDKKLILNFKVIAIDSLLLYDYLNRLRKNKKFEIKKSIEKSYKKCVIEFGNSFDVFENISTGI